MMNDARALAASFLSEGSRHECARNFYFNNEFIRFSGRSPELEVAESCAKLSGVQLFE
jgi:hypothetical protein